MASRPPGSDAGRPRNGSFRVILAPGRLLIQGKKPSENREIDPKRTALVTSAEAFMDAIRGKTPSACDALTGFRATVVAITANQAITENKRIAFQPEWFAL